uniref:Uncharacterized protein n=1 Tax=Anguilla anguilla TaxID=7936 RepID=A0A0E9X5N9_ANGAN
MSKPSWWTGSLVCPLRLYCKYLGCEVYLDSFNSSFNDSGQYLEILQSCDFKKRELAKCPENKVSVQQ